MLSLGQIATASPGQQQIGTLTQAQGDVQIFAHPSKEVKGPPPHALFEGEYYSVTHAKVGDKVELGNIVRTAPGGMAKIVFENGDQVHVGTATAYRVFWDQNEKPRTTFRLLYGKLRNIVSKVGPRNNLEVKTADVVMGVRGTDFYVERRGTQNVTQVTTLRGAVELKAQDAVQAKPVEVKAGYSAIVAKPTTTEAPVAKTEKTEPGKAAETPKESKETTTVQKPAETKIEVRRTDQGELQKIHEVAVIKPREAEKAAPVAEPVAQEVKKLEAKAVETTLQDIKASDPTLYKQVVPVAQEAKVSSEVLNNRTVEHLSKTAPPAPRKVKPTRKELDEGDDNSYDKYFKMIN